MAAFDSFINAYATMQGIQQGRDKLSQDWANQEADRAIRQHSVDQQGQAQQNEAAYRKALIDHYNNADKNAGDRLNQQLNAGQRSSFAQLLSNGLDMGTASSLSGYQIKPDELDSMVAHAIGTGVMSKNKPDDSYSTYTGEGSPSPANAQSKSPQFGTDEIESAIGTNSQSNMPVNKAPDQSYNIGTDELGRPVGGDVQSTPLDQFSNSTPQANGMVSSSVPGGQYSQDELRQKVLSQQLPSFVLKQQMADAQQAKMESDAQARLQMADAATQRASAYGQGIDDKFNLGQVKNTIADKLAGIKQTYENELVKIRQTQVANGTITANARAKMADNGATRNDILLQGIGQRGRLMPSYQSVMTTYKSYSSALDKIDGDIAKNQSLFTGADTMYNPVDAQKIKVNAQAMILAAQAKRQSITNDPVYQQLNGYTDPATGEPVQGLFGRMTTTINALPGNTVTRKSGMPTFTGPPSGKGKVDLNTVFKTLIGAK